MIKKVYEFTNKYTLEFWAHDMRFTVETDSMPFQRVERLCRHMMLRHDFESASIIDPATGEVLYMYEIVDDDEETH